MANRGVVSWMRSFRIVGLLALAGSMVLMATNHFTDSDGVKSTFKDIIAYRYVLATTAIGAAYILLQLPFAVYYACTEKGMTRNECLLEFNFYGDKLISLILATGVGAGFVIGFELKRFIRMFFDAFAESGYPLNNDDRSKMMKFLDLGIASTALLALGLVCMFIVSVLSSINRNSST